jgi:predicted nucleotidyltransferase
MINNDILAIKDCILAAVGEACEKIYLFGSYAYGMPREDSEKNIGGELEGEV